MNKKCLVRNFESVVQVCTELTETMNTQRYCCCCAEVGKTCSCLHSTPTTNTLVTRYYCCSLLNSTRFWQCQLMFCACDFVIVARTRYGVERQRWSVDGSKQVTFWNFTDVLRCWKLKTKMFRIVWRLTNEWRRRMSKAKRGIRCCWIVRALESSCRVESLQKLFSFISCFIGSYTAIQFCSHKNDMNDDRK